MGDHVASSCSRGPRTEQSRTKLPLWDRKVASPICRALAEARAARVGEGSPCFQALGWEEVAVAGGGAAWPKESSPWTGPSQATAPTLPFRVPKTKAGCPRRRARGDPAATVIGEITN